MTGWPHDTSIQKPTSDNENVDAVFTLRPGHHSAWMQFYEWKSSERHWFRQTAWTVDNWQQWRYTLGSRNLLCLSHSDFQTQHNYRNEFSWYDLTIGRTFRTHDTRSCSTSACLMCNVCNVVGRFETFMFWQINIYLNWQEKAKERQLKDDMERELREKDKQLQELMAHHALVRYTLTYFLIISHGNTWEHILLLIRQIIYRHHEVVRIDTTV